MILVIHWLSLDVVGLLRVTALQAGMHAFTLARMIFPFAPVVYSHQYPVVTT
jgi:hypothetical protein